MSPESPFYPYPERPGVNIQQSLDTLSCQPQSPLTPEEKDAVLAFEHQLTYGPLPPLDNSENTSQGLESIWKTLIGSSTFYLEYFLTPEGQQQLAHTFKQPLESVNFTTIKEVTLFLGTFNYSLLKPNPQSNNTSNIPSLELTEKENESILGTLADNSRKYAEESFINHFKANNFQSTDNIPIPHRLSVITNPHVLLDKINKLHNLKIVHKNLTQQLPNQTNRTPLEEAKALMIQIHRQKTNLILTDLYLDAAIYAQQFIQSDQIPPTGFESFVFKYNPARQISRLDKFTHGAENAYENTDIQDYQVISSSINALIQQLEQQPISCDTPGNLSHIDPEILNSLEVGPTQFKLWAEKVLKTYNITDITVEIVPKGKTLSYSHKKKRLNIPSRFARKVFAKSPIQSALAILDHEIAHILQHQNKSNLPLAIMDNIGTGRSEIMAESGAVAWETDAYQHLFGANRTITGNYLSAIKTRLKGGNFPDCFLSYFKNSLKKNPDGDKNILAQTAFDRTLRIFRGGGAYGIKSLENHEPYVFNSKSLIYLEQELLSRKLRGTPNQKYFLLSGINIPTLAQLHKFGLFNPNSIQIPHIRPHEVITDNVLDLIHDISRQPDAPSRIS